MNLKPYILKRLIPQLASTNKATQDLYKKASDFEYKRVLAETVLKILRKYDLSLRLGKVISHENLIKEEDRNTISNDS